MRLVGRLSVLRILPVSWFVIISSVLKRLPFPAVAHATEAIGMLLYATIWRRVRRAVAFGVEMALRESRERAGEISSLSYRANLKFWADYALLAYGSDGDADRRLRKIDVPDRSVFAYLRSVDRPVLIVGLHMGNYLSGFAKVLEVMDTDRPFLTFRQLEHSEMEDRAYRHFRRRVSDFQVLRHTGRSALKALSHLRRGGMVATFVDLPRSFGPTQRVSLFGHPVELVVGPAFLALAARCIVAPVFLGLDEAGREVLICEPPFEAVQHDGETRDEALERIMERLARFVERSVRRHPEQWLMWSLLGRYVVRKTDMPPTASG